MFGLDCETSSCRLELALLKSSIAEREGEREGERGKGGRERWGREGGREGGGREIKRSSTLYIYID